MTAAAGRHCSPAGRAIFPKNWKKGIRERIMAITYNNLYLDIRQQLLRAGLRGPTLEARELVCCASGKSREQLYRDGRCMCPTGGAAGAAAGRSAIWRGAGGLPHRRVGVLRPAAGHLRERADPPAGHGGAGGAGAGLYKDAGGARGCWICAPAAAASAWRWPPMRPAAGWCWASWTRARCSSAVRTSAATT